MLAFDIETTGLDFRAHRITVACIYDPDRGIKRAFNFAADPSMHDSERDAFIRALDDAPSLCCFNGTRFDIPFIAHSFGLSPEKQGQWVLKSLDLFEVCRLCFRSSCSLNNLLKANGHEVKSSSGSQAVQWAAEGQWDLLEDYCMQVGDVCSSGWLWLIALTKTTACRLVMC